jgi:hypothetical protein
MRSISVVAVEVVGQQGAPIKQDCPPWSFRKSSFGHVKKGKEKGFQ